MDGVLLVDKEQDYTSFDVVAKLRGILHMKKIGHGGTLDPQATGVLPVFLGSATKLCDYLPDETKVYETEMFLGRTTDTGDIWGQILEEREPVSDEELIRNCILSFVGRYDQVPPMFSAKKINGKKLYELARKGEVIERKAVPLTIKEIRILSMDLPHVRFTVFCEKGTYIRTLCEDIGKKLGCGACMSALRRLQHGSFNIEDAHTLSEIERARDDGRLSDMILTVEEVLPYPKLLVPDDLLRLIRNGNKLPVDRFEIPCIGLSDQFSSGVFRYKMKDRGGTFYGVYQFTPGAEMLVPEKMFLQKD